MVMDMRNAFIFNSNGVIPVIFVACFVFISASTAQQYEPNWDSLDSRPLPAWYDESKFGIFIHWGVFSVPSFDSEWFWWSWQGLENDEVVEFMADNYKKDFAYADFASMFTAEFYDPDQWAEILEASGAKYVVLTSKHHEGFLNYASKYSWNWNAMDVGPKRDLVGDLAAAIRNRTKMHFGLYYSLFEWFNPMYTDDKGNGFETQEYCERILWPELKELIEKYKPEVLWSDGEWEAPDTYWNSTGFLAWLYNKSPVKDTIVTNDRWGKDTRCSHGDFYTCSDYFRPGHLVKHKWENCMTIDKYSWGYRRNAQLKDYLNMDELVELLASTVSTNGNLLMNIGPTADGRIIPIFEDRLRSMGEWLGVNGEAIFETRPWRVQNDNAAKGVWYTSKPTEVYAIVLDWPANRQITLGAPIPNAKTMLYMLGYEKPLLWKGFSGKPGINVTWPQFDSPDALPCKWAWVIKIIHVM